MELSNICVISTGEFQGLTVYKQLPAEGSWQAYVFADAGCDAGDILRCTENTLRTGKATLGVREKPGFWNKITGLFYKFFAGLKLRDAEPPVIALPQAPQKTLSKARLLLNMKGPDFDQIPVSQTKQSGFFRLIGTWLLILGHFIKYGLSAVASALIEEGLLALLGRLFLGVFSGFAFTAVTAGLARLISSVCNFFINKKLVFESRGGTGKALLRYYAVAVPNALLQIGLSHGAYLLFGITEAQTLMRGLIHFGVMVLLFCVSFVVQQRWVFKKDC